MHFNLADWDFHEMLMERGETDQFSLLVEEDNDEAVEVTFFVEVMSNCYLFSVLITQQIYQAE